MTEVWDLVDESGNKIGVKWPRADHDNLPKGAYHSCVEVWIRVGDRLLITQRHPEKSEGLKYDCPGGAVLSGESLIDGALRELFEEVGIRLSEEGLIPLGHSCTKRAFAMSYLALFDELPKLSLQASEVVGYRLVSSHELECMSDQLTNGTYKRYKLFKDKLF